ncbi:hypothetical protein HERIO_465 [Hepatospora eriocheir]|uniref:Uncharacterized protein n=1 Tax=Hepatospora eriocheir TaxID=1081669 RepID=A0A1X0QD16_9MICR|nr:hypothetical protein HERIO_465 [Hepatospora eriocheir]
MNIFYLCNLIKVVNGNNSNQNNNEECNVVKTNHEKWMIKTLYTFLFLNPHEILLEEDSNKTDDELFLETCFTHHEVITMIREIDNDYSKNKRFRNIQNFASVRELACIFYNKDIKEFNKFKESQRKYCSKTVKKDIEKFNKFKESQKDYDTETVNVFFKRYKDIFEILRLGICNRILEDEASCISCKCSFKNNQISINNTFEYQLLNDFIIFNKEFFIVNNINNFLKGDNFEIGYYNEFKDKLLKPFLKYIETEEVNIQKKELDKKFLNSFKKFMEKVYNFAHFDKYVGSITLSKDKYKVFVKKELKKGFNQIKLASKNLKVNLKKKNYELTKSINNIICFSYALSLMPQYAESFFKF